MTSRSDGVVVEMKCKEKQRLVNRCFIGLYRFMLLPESEEEDKPYENIDRDKYWKRIFEDVAEERGHSDA